MHLHLTNCHGEWTTLALLFASLPWLGAWLRGLVAQAPRSGTTRPPDGP
jgi:hypothetical protein